MTILAGKLHALLARNYTKGRDLYDLFWYLTDRNWPEPNFTFLNNALNQTGWDSETINSENWKTILLDRLEMVDWNKAIEDVRPFLEHPEEIHLLTRKNIFKLLRNDSAIGY